MASMRLTSRIAPGSRDAAGPRTVPSRAQIMNIPILRLPRDRPAGPDARPRAVPGRFLVEPLEDRVLLSRGLGEGQASTASSSTPLDAAGVGGSAITPPAPLAGVGGDATSPPVPGSPATATGLATIDPLSGVSAPPAQGTVVRDAATSVDVAATAAPTSA